MGLAAIYAAVGQANSEMSHEESYMQETIELIIIRETSRAGSRELKLIALEQIGKSIGKGSVKTESFMAEVLNTLEYLSLEGTHHKTMQGRQITNNYPDVRRQSAKYLGFIGTSAAKAAVAAKAAGADESAGTAKKILMRICIAEHDPMVLYEAITALGSIGINDNNDVVNNIIQIANENNNANNPNNYIALAAVNALAKFAEKDSKLHPIALPVITKIREGPYSANVREHAKQALTNLDVN